ncbi:hypothetical protein SAMN05216184_11132 [Georgenia satyanarayanai]|uniref:Uncharacterized protein n=1 Tax=Georgenia satyanarayanai TaxID=860221 RepID=A0A2Y9ANT6_9MICO|nr:hypothetical protein [Georgenia satyanarayanai]PYF98380.1 hypothetical protein A8987_11132 [Georgenia satyanarayanai]SSA44998.1 hypothetical protein SAMN05216184_11132 [Georgenia satyanarayanai]
MVDDDVLRRLHATGASLGRPPEPVPEADPWDPDDPLDARSPVVVVFPGPPHLRVRLHDDGEDAVHLDTYVTFDVPRRHTVDVVRALLSKDGVYTRAPRGLLGVVSRRLRLEFLDELAVDVPGATYTQAVPWVPTSPLNGWISGLPRRP